METLASILAGIGANPYQQGQGIAPLLSQALLQQQLAPVQIGQQQAPSPQAQVQPQPMTPQTMAGMGGMGATNQYPQEMPGAAALPLLLSGIY